MHVIRYAVWALSCAALFATPRFAHADARALTCRGLADQASSLRTDGKLEQARESLRACLSRNCSAEDRAACSTGLAAVERVTPSIVLRAQEKASGPVTVMVDGVRKTTNFAARPLEVDPGEHLFVFQAKGFLALSKQLTLAEGEKEKPIRLTFEPDPGTAQAAEDTGSGESERAGHRPVPPSAYLLAGVSVVSLATAGILGASTLSRRSELERTCKPDCSASQVSDLKSRFHIADGFLAGGVLSAGVALVLYLTRPTAPALAMARALPRVSVNPVRSGATMSLTLKF